MMHCMNLNRNSLFGINFMFYRCVRGRLLDILVLFQIIYVIYSVSVYSHIHILSFCCCRHKFTPVTYNYCIFFELILSLSIVVFTAHDKRQQAPSTYNCFINMSQKRYRGSKH